MNQVVGGAAASKSLLQRGLNQDIAFDDFQLRVLCPRTILEFFRGTSESSNMITGIQQKGHKTGTNIPGCSSNKNGFCISLLSHDDLFLDGLISKDIILKNPDIRISVLLDL
jgi:hypothetical protein